MIYLVDSTIQCLNNRALTYKTHPESHFLMISGKTSVNGPGSLVHLGSLKCIHPVGGGYKILEGIKLVLYDDCSSSRWVDHSIHVSQRFRAVLRKASIEAPCPPYLCKPWVEKGDKYAWWKKHLASNQTREKLFYWDCPLLWKKGRYIALKWYELGISRMNETIVLSAILAVAKKI